jgi:hypothetical protein
MKSETKFLLRRASEEARQAIRSTQPEAEEIHNALSIRYSAKALILLAKEDEAMDSSEMVPRFQDVFRS